MIEEMCFTILANDHSNVLHYGLIIMICESVIPRFRL